jgi:hypothetical protein
LELNDSIADEITSPMDMSKIINDKITTKPFKATPSKIDKTNLGQSMRSQSSKLSSLNNTNANRPTLKTKKQ